MRILSISSIFAFNTAISIVNICICGLEPRQFASLVPLWLFRSLWAMGDVLWFLGLWASPLWSDHLGLRARTQAIQSVPKFRLFSVMSWMLRTWHSGRPILFLSVRVGKSAHVCCAGENLYFQRAPSSISQIGFAPACPALYQSQDIQSQYYERYNHLCSTNERISLIDCYTSSQFNVVSEEACT